MGYVCGFPGMQFLYMRCGVAEWERLAPRSHAGTQTSAFDLATDARKRPETSF
jgi:hypothetical protein